jgi:imidazolonepropionase
MRCQGKSYREIAEAGGGIRFSVRSLRSATEEQLIIEAIPRLDRFLKNGTTTIEAKSGYGLSLGDELKMLRVIRKLNEMHQIDIIPTFLGAHEIPDEYRNRRRQYIDLIINEMIPQVAEEKLAQFCDVFCEDHVFNVNESEEILNAAKSVGLKIKIHADQLTSGKGADMAAALGAVSADHLDYSDSYTVEQLKQHGVIPVLLPGAVFFLGLTCYANARAMIDSGLPVAIATDFNPGSCTIQSMSLIISIACIYMHMTPTEAWIASTLNAAKSVCHEHKLGMLEKDMQADIVIWDIPNENYLAYDMGNSSVDTVIKKGRFLQIKSF